MKTTDLMLIRMSVDRLAEDSEGMESDFFSQLFRRDPVLTSMMQARVAHNGDHLVGMLSSMVNGLEDGDTLLHLAGALGRPDLTRGIQPRHYIAVGQALIDTLALRLGERFTEPMRMAWTEAYVMLAEAVMAVRCNRMDLAA